MYAYDACDELHGIYDLRCVCVVWGIYDMCLCVGGAYDMHLCGCVFMICVSVVGYI